MRILFLIHKYPNYVPDILLHGLRKTLGPEVVEYPRKDCLYEGVLGLGVCPENQLCPGWFPEEDGSIDRDDIGIKIQKGYFNLIVADQRIIPWQNEILLKSGLPLVIIDGEDQPARIPAGKWIVCRRETDGSDFSIPLPMALPEEVFNLITTFDSEPKRYSIGFLGSTHDGARRDLVESLSRWYPDSLFATTEVPDDEKPDPGGRLGRIDYYRSLQQCRMVLSLPGAGYDTFRFWENSACNAVHLAQQMPVFIPDDFAAGQHLLRFDNPDELRIQADLLLDREDRRRKMIREQRYHLYRHHFSTCRATYFLDRVNQALGKTTYRPGSIPGPVSASVFQKEVFENIVGMDGNSHKPERDQNDYQKDSPGLYLGLVRGENYGWGVCSEKLIAELSRLAKVHVVSEQDGSAFNRQLPGDFFQALTNVDLYPIFPGAKGRRNFGYTFFENELTAQSMKNARDYDLVLAGSTWCRDRLLEKGINNCDVLLQGIDPEIFRPGDLEPPEDRFVIFSGGKFELRKGQDLVIKAVKVLMDKYPDVFLVTCWYNLWPESMRLMQYSNHIRFEYRPGRSWVELMEETCQNNGLDPERVVINGLVPHHRQRQLYLQTHLGLFPNRCEGGTNLVLMEYMACGRPVIGSFTSGHKDVLTRDNALLLTELQDYMVRDSDGRLIARWKEASLDEIVACLEQSYHHREDLAALGKRAARDMAGMTWKESARQLLDLLGG